MPSFTAMASGDYDLLPSPSLPNREAIMALCNEAGYCGGTGLPLCDAESGAIVAWVKYGPYVTVNEAQTQNFVAEELSRTPGAALRAPHVFDAFEWEHPAFTVGCIVMEHVDGNDCGPGNVGEVAKAVQSLISIGGPDFKTPGHIGGGSLIHPFFFDWVAPAHLTSVTDLQDHINNVLEHKGDLRRVDIVSEAAGSLFLCPCDIDPGNFRRSTDGQLFALDFRATCLLPPSFFAVAMSLSDNPFCRRVARKVAYEQTVDVSAMVSASNYLVQFGMQPVGRNRRKI